MATKTNTTINGNNYFRIRRTVGHTPDGKPIIKNFYGTSKGDAEKQYKLYLEDEARKKFQKKEYDDNATFHDRAEEYIRTSLRVSQKYSNSTKYQYELNYDKHIKGSFLDLMPMKDIKARDIQRLYNESDVSLSVIQGMNRFLAGMFKWMVLNDYSDNLMVGVEIPQKKDNKRHEGIVTWSDEEIASIISALDAPCDSAHRHRQTFMIFMLLYTGMRIGEILALKYDDIRDGMIYVRRQYHMYEIKPPKYNSVRIIPMHEELKKRMDMHIAWQQEDMQIHHYMTDYLFTTSSGKLYDPRSLRRALERFYESIGVEYKHPHAYRATFCTYLCRCGVPLEVASELMGHKSIEVTARHYALVRPDTKQSAIDRLKYV